MSKYRLGSEEFSYRKIPPIRLESLTNFKKHFNAPMVVFIRNLIVLQTVKFKASLI